LAKIGGQLHTTETKSQEAKTTSKISKAKYHNQVSWQNVFLFKPRNCVASFCVLRSFQYSKSSLYCSEIVYITFFTFCGL